MNYLPELIGHHITLRPLMSSDEADIIKAASDGELWNLNFTVIPSAKTAKAYIDKAISGRNEKTVIPFVIVDNATNKIIGSTRYFKIDLTNRKLEIGHTWYSESYQRTYANTEAKYLLLKYAIEELKCVRVQFTTDEINHKSRNAILRIGAKQEGIIRNERIMPNGRIRNAVRFSIIDTEWQQIKKDLIKRLSKV
jgi:RimJ/RimL family protein N-acetyltransferase